MRFNDIDPARDLAQNEILVRFFGELELENRRGRLDERQAKPQALTWPTLKYLLVNANRDVEQEELLALAYPGKTAASGDGAMRTRLRRVRDILKPLGLDSMRGLILFSAGKYRVNPDFRLITDEDEFNRLLRRLSALPENDPEGLSLCAEALELCRGAYLGCTPDADWLRPCQEQYRREFRRLGEQTLARMRALNDDGPAAMLWRRAVLVAPEDEALHRAVIAFLSERRQDTELIRYVNQLLRRGAPWLPDSEIL